MNAKFILSYDGVSFLGSQTQVNRRSIEDKLQETFKSLNIDTKVILSSRTDKNVHATGQVFNCILPSYWHNLDKLKEMMNRHLPLNIRIHKIVEVQKDFHSRFHAKKRVYRYLITQKELTAFNSKYLTHHKMINKDKIDTAIKSFIGVHNFEYFHKKGSDKDNTVREIFDAKFYKYKDLYIFKFVANSYLRSQIRLMVGSLLSVSQGKLSLEDLQAQLKREKHVFKFPASPYGLYLVKVIY